jgi:hypothetical protein
MSTDLLTLDGNVQYWSAWDDFGERCVAVHATGQRHPHGQPGAGQDRLRHLRFPFRPHRQDLPYSTTTLVTYFLFDNFAEIINYPYFLYPKF